jgi:hypothetical protein
MITDAADGPREATGVTNSTDDRRQDETLVVPGDETISEVSGLFLNGEFAHLDQGNRVKEYVTNR